jgi:hypothetical protein
MWQYLTKTIYAHTPTTSDSESLRNLPGPTGLTAHPQQQPQHDSPAKAFIGDGDVPAVPTSHTLDRRTSYMRARDIVVAMHEMEEETMPYTRLELTDHPAPQKTSTDELVYSSLLIPLMPY